MKRLFFLLLLINLVYFLWQYPREFLENDFVSVEQSTTKQILLLTEIPETKAKQ